MEANKMESNKYLSPWDSEGPYYEDFEIGMIIKSWPGRTFHLYDNYIWSAFSGDSTVAYIDMEYVKMLGHEKPIINYHIILNYLIAVAVRDTSQNSVAFLGTDYFKIHKPVFDGDTVYVESEVISKRESKSRPEAGIVTWIHRGYNQNNELVAEVRRTNLVYKKEFSPWKNYLKKVGKI